MKKKVNKNGQDLKVEEVYYECQCDCGTIITAKASDLMSGKVWACPQCMLEKKN